jgi:hypothetical protein
MSLANFRRVNIRLDKANEYYIETQFAKFGDYNSRELVVQVTDADVIKDQTGVTLNFGWMHNSVNNTGLEPFQELDVLTGLFGLNYPSEMMNAGTVTCVIHIIEEGKITVSRYFNVIVEASPIDETTIVSENEQELVQTFSSIFKVKKTLKNDAWFGWKTINFIGDSISHGANCTDIESDAFVSVMKRFLQEEYETTNQGYTTMYASMANGAYKTVLDIVETGTWTKMPDGEHLGLYVYSSSESGATLSITINKQTKQLRVMYDKLIGGGTLNVKLDGITKFTVATDGTSEIKNVFTLGVLDLSNEKFPCTIEIEKTDANLTKICGLQMYDDETQLMINNYGRTGARLTYVSDDLLNLMCDTNVAFFALGHNDRFFEDDGTFTQKINTAITKFKSVGTYVVVLDFIWDLSIDDNIYKQELKRLADECGGTYINFNELLPYGSDITKWISSGFLSDTSHPTEIGHKVIAETMANRIGLGYRVKCW